MHTNEDAIIAPYVLMTSEPLTHPSPDVPSRGFIKGSEQPIRGWIDLIMPLKFNLSIE